MQLVLVHFIHCLDGKFGEYVLNGSLIQFKIATELHLCNLMSPPFLPLSYFLALNCQVRIHI